MSLNTTTSYVFLPDLHSVLDLKSWYPPPTRAVQPRPWFLPATLFAFIACSLLPRSVRLSIAGPALLLLLSQTRVTSTGDAVKDFGRAMFIAGWVLKFIDYGMLVKEGELYRIKDVQGKDKGRGPREVVVEDEEEERKKGTWKKLKDIVELWLFNMRGIGWNWQVGGIAERALQSRTYFLYRTGLRILGSLLLLDLCRFTSSQIPYIHLSPRSSFFALPPTTQVLLTWLHQLEAFVYINVPYQVFAFVAVLVRLHAPEDWPPFFGSLGDAYLVSRAWGRTWHQGLRRPLGLLTPHAQRWLGAEARGARRTVGVFSSFFMSGVLHWSGALNIPWTPSAHGMFTYFMMQAPVIRLEDWLVDFGRGRGVQGNRMLFIIGYLWTFAWISFSMRYAAGYQFESGALSQFKPLDFSLINYILAKTSQQSTI